MNTIRMHLDREPFEMIKSGEKTFELRLYDEKRRAIEPGCTIIFTNGETCETLSARVLSIRVFRSFEELYRALPLDKCGYRADELALASPRDMEKYYPAELVERFGCAAIELETVRRGE